MSQKVLTICNLESDLQSKYCHSLNYLPLSNEETDDRWQELIKSYQPNVIVFGLQTIDEPKLAFWRSVKPKEKLRVVRKGTSLHRVDFAAAERHQVEVQNTAGVNAPFVADFIIANLDLDKNASPVAVIGTGDIGRRVTSHLLEQSAQVLLYNRTKYSFTSNNYQYLDDLQLIFSKSPHIAICLPLTAETNGIITPQHINLLPKNSKIVCISPPRVFSSDAIQAIHHRKDLSVIFDHVASGLAHIHESLGHTHLREHFVFEEKAAASHDCQYAMGEAAIRIALSAVQP